MGKTQAQKSSVGFQSLSCAMVSSMIISMSFRGCKRYHLYLGLTRTEWRWAGEAMLLGEAVRTCP